MRKNRKQIWASEEFVGLMGRVKRDLNLNISDPETTRIIAEGYEGRKETLGKFLGRKVKKRR